MSRAAGKLARRLVLPLACALSLAAPPAGGAEGADARSLFEQGRQLLGAKRYVVALDRFMRAARLVQRPSVLLNIAQCLRLLELPDEALRAYREYLQAWRAARPSAAPPYLNEVTGHIALLERQVALFEQGRARAAQGDFPGALSRWSTARTETAWPRLSAQMARARLQLGHDAAAAQLARATQQAYATLLARWISVAPRESFPGIAAIDEDLQLAQDVLAALRRAAAPPPPPPPRQLPPAEPLDALLILDGVPAHGTVTVDGRRVELADGALRLAPGRHRVVVTARGHRPWRARIRLEAGERLTQRVQLAHRPSTGWLVAGIGAAALGAGAEVAALLFAEKANDLYTNDPNFPRYRSATIAGHISAGVLAAAAAVSFYLYFRTPGRAPRGGNKAALGVTPTAGGAMLHGGFAY